VNYCDSLIDATNLSKQYGLFERQKYIVVHPGLIKLVSAKTTYVYFKALAAKHGSPSSTYIKKSPYQRQ
jgi:hypothetical protein